jgi:hypothetical protein
MLDEEDCELGEEGNPLVPSGGKITPDEAFKPPAKSTRGGESREEDVSFYSVNKMKQRLYAQTYECLIATAVVIVICGGCAASYAFCQPCLLGILVFSACMCPWIPYFNVPLWVSIIMLISLGWHFTVGHLTLTWQ